MIRHAPPADGALCRSNDVCSYNVLLRMSSGFLCGIPAKIRTRTGARQDDVAPKVNRPEPVCPGRVGIRAVPVGEAMMARGGRPARGALRPHAPLGSAKELR